MGALLLVGGALVALLGGYWWSKSKRAPGPGVISPELGAALDAVLTPPLVPEVCKECGVNYPGAGYGWEGLCAECADRDFIQGFGDD
jgi:hypothetical protein